ncbi:MAG: methionyl-tRNA formyltransferase [Acidimicrobiales bacterium]
MPAAVPVHPRRLVYLGSPAAAVPPLEALHAAGHDIALVVSQPDRRRGRGGATSPSPVKAAAVALGLPVTDRVDDVLDVGADLGVVVAFGRLLKAHVLDAVPIVNLHFSLLPRWRGAAPVERAILAGDEQTGVAVMGVDETLDTGVIYAEAVLPIGPDETADELRARLVAVGTDLLVATLAAGLTDPRPQEGESTYADKLGPDDLRLDWDRPAVELHRVVRVGGAWTTFRGRRLKVWRTRLADDAGDGRGDDGGASLAPGAIDGVRVGTGDGALELVEVQPEGKGRQDAVAWRNGARPEPGERLGDQDSA